MTRAKTLTLPWRLDTSALLLGVAMSLVGAGSARPDTVNPAPSQAAAPAAPMPAWAQGFVCHAQPGGWCDLRDWRGFGEPPAPQQAAAPAR